MYFKNTVSLMVEFLEMEVNERLKQKLKAALGDKTKQELQLIHQQESYAVYNLSLINNL